METLTETAAETHEGLTIEKLQSAGGYAVRRTDGHRTVLHCAMTIPECRRWIRCGKGSPHPDARLHHKYNRCPRCGGTGYVPYDRDGGICYGCWGTGLKT